MFENYTLDVLVQDYEVLSAALGSQNVLVVSLKQEIRSRQRQMKPGKNIDISEEN
jgi:hypothetical protein